MTAIVEIEELGRRIRKLRLERRLTLKQVEQASGLSATHLSEIERGRTSPTIGALVRIARALEKEASYFIEHDERPDIAHTVAGALPQTSGRGGAATESLSPGIPGSRVFAYRVRLANGRTASFEAAPDDAEQASIYFVRSGTVTGRFGDATTRLAAGDTAHAANGQPHELRATDGDAEVIVMTTRSFDT